MLKFELGNSRKQGDAGMGIAIGWFAANGHTVCIPLTDSQDFDLVVTVNEKLKKVQVRTTKYKRYGKSYVVNLVVSGGNRSGIGKRKKFDSNLVDYLFVVTEENKKYYIPSFEITQKRVIYLTKKWDKFIVV